MNPNEASAQVYCMTCMKITVADWVQWYTTVYYSYDNNLVQMICLYVQKKKENITKPLRGI